MNILRRIIVTLLLSVAMSIPVSAQTLEGCFTPAQSTSGPPAITLWCQIIDYSPNYPLTSTWDTGSILLQRGFTTTVMHVQYDPWYAPMDSVFTVEIGTFTQAIVLPQFEVTTSADSYTQDIPLGELTAAAGNTIRITELSTIPHTCNPLDNCGLHLVITFE